MSVGRKKLSVCQNYVAAFSCCGNYLTLCANPNQQIRVKKKDFITPFNDPHFVRNGIFFLFSYLTLFTGGRCLLPLARSGNEGFADCIDSENKNFSSIYLVKYLLLECSWLNF